MPFKITHVVAQMASFEDIYFRGETKIRKNPKNFVPQKFLAKWYTYTHKHTHKHTHTNTRTHKHTPTHTNTHIIQTHTHIVVQILTKSVTHTSAPVFIKTSTTSA